MGIVDRLHALDARLGIGRIPRALERRVDDWPGAREAWDVRDDDARRAVVMATARGEASLRRELVRMLLPAPTEV